MQTFWQDVRYGARTLLKNPGFTLIAILTLALGIGANTAIFSVVNGVLLRPLSYHEPERIVTLLNHGGGPVSPANFLDIRANSKSYEQMSVAEAWRGTLTNNDRPEVVAGLRMGDGMFDLLGIPPLLGRTFQPDDFQAGKDHILVLSHKLWQRAFGGDAKIVGQQITLSGESFSVVGVMPPEFQFPPFWSTRAEMWAPLDLRPRANSRGGSSLRVFARLKPDVSQQQANAAVLDHVIQPLLRVLGIERHIAAASLQYGQQADRQGYRIARHGNTHAHFRPHAQIDQAISQSVGVIIQFGIAELYGLGYDCNRIGMLSGLRLETLVQR